MKSITLILVASLLLVSCKKEMLVRNGRIKPNWPTTRTSTTSTEALIGTRTWMTKNLDVMRYANGDIIPEVKDSAGWLNRTTGAWCYYNNDARLGIKYGKLYNWAAVTDPRGLAPKGWHVAVTADWIDLFSVVTTEQLATSEFAAVQAGGRFTTFFGLDSECNWWVPPIDTQASDFMWMEVWDNRMVYLQAPMKNLYSCGFSVRCVKD